MKPSSLEIRRVLALEALTNIQAELKSQLDRIETKLDALLACMANAEDVKTEPALSERGKKAK